MDEQQIQDIANRVIAALEQLKPLAPGEPAWYVIVASLAPVAALLAAGLVTFIGWRNLKHQQKALKVSMQNDDRSEWWKRAQWALEAEATDNDKLSAAGTEMLKLLVKSEMASDADKDLLDTSWRAGTAATNQETAEELLAEAEAFVNEADLDDTLESSDNEETKEVENG
ncbi:hypothetical protein [Arthrobacter sp. AD-310]